MVLRHIGVMMQATAWIAGCVVLAVAAWVYLVESYDPITGTSYDGLGRALHGGSTVFGLDRSPGLFWEVLDVAAVLVVFSLVGGLYKLGEWLKRRGTRRHRPAS